MAAWIDGGAKLDMGGEDSDVFEPHVFPEDSTAETIARMWDVVERHAGEALQVAGISIEETTRPLLLQAMLGPVAAAKVAAQNPQRSLKELYEAWKVAAVVKPRTIAETEHAFKAISALLGNDDAAQVTRDVPAKWRDCIKGAGATNNTWNNRLSMVRQFLVFGVAEGYLATDPTDKLRLRKNRQTSPCPTPTPAPSKSCLPHVRRRYRPCGGRTGSWRLPE